MKIDGNEIAEKITLNLINRIGVLRKRGIVPKIGIVLAGNDPASELYVERKKKFGEKIGASVDVIHFRPARSENGRRQQAITSFLRKVNAIDSDESYHGIIIQRPVPLKIDEETLRILVSPQKDIDGFRKDSLFTPPISLAVKEILGWVIIREKGLDNLSDENFIKYLKGKKLLVIGRGVTGGRPISDMFKKIGVGHKTASRSTPDIPGLVKGSSIIISCVGKHNIVRHIDITGKPVVIGVGMHKYRGKFEPDFNQEEISKKASYFTPVPGGIGPVNVAFLFSNLVKAAENNSNLESGIMNQGRNQ